MVGLESLAVGATERVGKLFGGLGNVLAKGDASKLETTGDGC